VLGLVDRRGAKLHNEVGGRRGQWAKKSAKTAGQRGGERNGSSMWGNANAAICACESHAVPPTFVRLRLNRRLLIT